MIKCKCGYEWKTKSKMLYVNCPRCMLKVRIKPTSKQMIKSFAGFEK